MGRHPFSDLILVDLEELLPGFQMVRVEHVEFIMTYLEDMGIDMDSDPLVIFAPHDISTLANFFSDILTKWEKAKKEQ